MFILDRHTGKLIYADPLKPGDSEKLARGAATAFVKRNPPEKVLGSVQKAGSAAKTQRNPMESAAKTQRNEATA